MEEEEEYAIEEFAIEEFTIFEAPTSNAIETVKSQPVEYSMPKPVKQLERKQHIKAEPQYRIQSESDSGAEEDDAAEDSDF